ncbi:DNA-binding NtrC family response regulator [Rhodoblastus acidophilus]|uniref:response regulator n=1 Tax=Rhodoblastus acidophilus TaxID=1074 RepID=UPI0022245A8A|nr:response regulator [Rhodoblastus acidophilus]MCW2286284.1 DNA-binding NtrC family response regulator [Rhodoblastus acidophilus]MCW2335136.1 DNA-binding NtrC family response regulator [Rhodoblastus acidophilus]
MSARARVLIVEDEALVAFALEEMLGDFGYEVIGPAPNVQAALKLVGAEKIDAAILDVNLGGETIEPVAEALAGGGVPFVFTTGYTSASALPPNFKDRPSLNKPYQPEALRDAVARLLKP